MSVGDIYSKNISDIEVICKQNNFSKHFQTHTMYTFKQYKLFLCESFIILTSELKM